MKNILKSLTYITAQVTAQLRVGLKIVGNSLSWRLKALTKRQRLAILAGAAILALGIGAGAFALHNHKQEQAHAQAVALAQAEEAERQRLKLAAEKKQVLERKKAAEAKAAAEAEAEKKRAEEAKAAEEQAKATATSGSSAATGATSGRPTSGTKSGPSAYVPPADTHQSTTRSLRFNASSYVIDTSVSKRVSIVISSDDGSLIENPVNYTPWGEPQSPVMLDYADGNGTVYPMDGTASSWNVFILAYGATPPVGTHTLKVMATSNQSGKYTTYMGSVQVIVK